MIDNNPWISSVRNTVTVTKKLLTNLSIKVRTSQYRLFIKLLKPKSANKILDVGVTSDETLKDSNLFERLYPYPQNLTAATIETPSRIKKLYPKISAVKIFPGKKLPFNNKQFDVVTSWATLEHVGGKEDQRFFIKELLRVGKKIFLTTPYKYCFYEPHSEVFFLHWLPDKLFRRILRSLGKTFWAKETNLKPLGIRDIKAIIPDNNVKIKLYCSFPLLPTHLIIYKI